jgi:hypothetical protein
MFQYFNNTNNRKKRNSNSDLTNIRDEYANLKTATSSNMFSNISLNEIFKTNQRKIQEYQKINNSEKKFDETNKNNKIKIEKFNEDKIFKNIIKKIKDEKNNSNMRKTRTQMEFNWQKETFFKTFLDKIPNISFIKKNEKKKSETIQENKIIYYNTLMENFYKSKNINKYPMKTYKKCLSTLTTTNKIHLIDNLLKIYKRKNIDDKTNITIKAKKIDKKENKKEEANNNILKGFNFISGCKSELKILFQKTPIKIQNSIPSKGKKFILNPITNSYGNLLDNLSEKIGFMKDSMDMIYPKISQAKFMIKGPKKDCDSISQSKSSIGWYNLEQIKDLNIIYKIKKRKINQTIYSKYPTYSRNKFISEKLLPIKKYSLKKEKIN